VTSRDVQDERNPEALILWWDLGSGASPAVVGGAQELISELVSAASLLVAIQRETIRYPGTLLLQRDGRFYLRLAEAERRTRITPFVVAAGYSNPWWEVLQDLPPAVEVAGAAGAGTAVVAFVDRLIDLAKKAILFRFDLSATRHALRSAIEEDEELAVLRAADEVDGRGVDREQRWRADPSRAPRPSVSVDEADDPLVALAADRVLDAVAQLTRALNEESDFGSELLGAQDALQRLQVIRETQASLLELARGDIETSEFDERMLRRRLELYEEEGVHTAETPPVLGRGSRFDDPPREIGSRNPSSDE
jgi:hypothetical protein